jgi:dihydrodipicolinate synthase/N-acetylneuraminate lyase
MSVFCGDDTMAFESLLLGAKGWVAASANLIPNKCAKLFELMEKGNIAEARDLWFKIVPLTSSVEGWGRLVQTIKKGLDLLGRAGGPSPRGPKLGIKKEQEVELKRMLTQLGELS